MLEESAERGAVVKDVTVSGATVRGVAVRGAAVRGVAVRGVAVRCVAGEERVARVSGLDLTEPPPQYLRGERKEEETRKS